MGNITKEMMLENVLRIIEQLALAVKTGSESPEEGIKMANSCNIDTLFPSLNKKVRKDFLHLILATSTYCATQMINKTKEKKA